jgi:PPM family protein phosphatase
MHLPFVGRRTPPAYAVLTDAGRRHERNEDAVAAIAADGRDWGFELALIVCDGVSGQPRAEMGSSLSIEAFRATLSQRDRRPMAQRLRAAAAAASAAIVDFAKREADGAAVASTVVALVLSGHSATIGYVGNSRCYLRRAGVMTLLTHDHSFVAEQVRQGIITAADAKHHPFRSRITRALGAVGADAMDVVENVVQPGDLFLLSSDGLHDVIDDDHIHRAISRDLERSARALIDLANAAGGPDNITVALCEVG